MPAAPPQTIEEVIDRMTSLEQTLDHTPGPSYGAYCFNRLYLAVTQGVKQAVDQAGFFADPERLAQLDVTFAALYLDALEAMAAAGDPPAAWKVLFDRSADPLILPIQFAVAGMNAHINHDLPIALVEHWKACGGRPRAGEPAHADYLRVNAILQAEEAREKAIIEPAVLAALDRVDGGWVGRLDSRLAMWSVEDARNIAWETAKSLWEVRRSPVVRRAMLDALGGVVALSGAGFLTPL